jgi:Methyltransferase domain
MKNEMAPDPSLKWNEIPGWFQWRSGQMEAVQHFPDGSRFVEVGNFLGRSLCSLAEVAELGGKHYTLVGVDTCQGSGVEGSRGRDYQGAAVAEARGTFAGMLHRNIIGCGYDEVISLIITNSITASGFFANRSLDWVHLDARHELQQVQADIRAWLPKVKVNGWLSGDDYDAVKWPGVVTAVRELLPEARPWSSQQWRWVVSGSR